MTVKEFNAFIEGKLGGTPVELIWSSPVPLDETIRNIDTNEDGFIHCYYREPTLNDEISAPFTVAIFMMVMIVFTVVLSMQI